MLTNIHERYPQKTGGSVFVIALLLATVLLLFSMTYFRVARENKAFEYRSEQNFLARDTANLIHQEAFSSLEKDGRTPNSELFWFLQGAVPGAQTEVKLPFSRTNASKLLPTGFSCEFSCIARVTNFIRNDHLGKAYGSKYEGHGIISLIIEVEVKNDGSQRERPARHKLEIHHDYLIASMVCATPDGSKLTRALISRRDNFPFDENIFSNGDSSLVLSQENSPDYNSKPENLTLFNRPTLWKHRNLEVQKLKDIGIIDLENNIINLNGIIQLNGSLEIDQPMKVSGRGVIIADSVTISAQLLKKSSKDLLVLYARKGKIVVNTPEKVEAGLIAINRTFNGTVEALKPLNLKGLIVVDRLNLISWGKGEHLIVYDDMFSQTDENLQMSFSQWHVFHNEAVK